MQVEKTMDFKCVIFPTRHKFGKSKTTLVNIKAPQTHENTSFPCQFYAVSKPFVYKLQQASHNVLEQNKDKGVGIEWDQSNRCKMYPLYRNLHMLSTKTRWEVHGIYCIN